MIIDSRTVPDGATLDTEVCIVGSGPAALTLAKAFAGRDFRVCLFEGGAPEMPQPATRQLVDVENAGEFLQVSSGDRNVQLGGNSPAWSILIGRGEQGLRLAPFDDVDFERRDWLPGSCGWPFDRAHLMPYYARAQRLFGLDRLRYEVDDWTSDEVPALPLDGTGAATKMFQFASREAFCRDALSEVDRSANVTSFVHAHALELLADATGQTVEKVQFGCTTGTRFQVRARQVILAAGGVGVPHLMLLSRRVHPQGIGNDHDLVGRHFMDHPLVTGGVVLPRDRSIFERTALYDLRSVDGVSVMGALGLSQDTMRHERLLNSAAWLWPRAHYFKPAPGVKALKSLAKGAWKSAGPAGLVRDLGQAARHPVDLAAFAHHKLRYRTFYPHLFRGGWSEPQHVARSGYQIFEVMQITEQAPHRDNRIRLGEATDALGRRVAATQTRWHEVDMDSICRTQDLLGHALESAGIGRYVPERVDGHPVLDRGGCAHHMGTTRMHEDPRQGVVDADCKVHGVSNLHVASSAVFPSGSFANPTLTIVAMAARLADHLLARLAAH